MQGSRYNSYEPGLKNEEDVLKDRYGGRWEDIWNYDITKDVDRLLKDMYGFA
jgi:hypothetical protein